MTSVLNVFLALFQHVIDTLIASPFLILMQNFKFYRLLNVKVIVLPFPQGNINIFMISVRNITIQLQNGAIFVFFFKQCCFMHYFTHDRLLDVGKVLFYSHIFKLINWLYQKSFIK